MGRSVTSILAAVVLVLAACGNDEDGAATGATQPGDAGGVGGEAADWCENMILLTEVGGRGPHVDFETASPEEIQAAVAAFGEEFMPIIETSERTAPAEIADDVAVMANASRTAIAQGSPDALYEPEPMEAESRVISWAVENCGYQVISITGVDYAYELDTTEVDGGVTILEFSNEGEELHEMIVFRKTDGVTESFEEILAMDEGHPALDEEMVEFVTAAYGPPGYRTAAFVDLEPGEYAVACFIPVGSTLESEGAGPRHLVEGMLSTFTVR
jgi:hypothetical protein